jgi:lipoate-protein ligase A
MCSLNLGIRCSEGRSPIEGKDSNYVIECTESTGNGSAGDLAVSVELLRAVAASDIGRRIVRVYRPEPTVAFSRRESFLPGFAKAVESAASDGFTPVIRPTGGRAVAYDDSCLVIDVISPEPDRHPDSVERFQSLGLALATALRHVGVEAHVGEVAGEYCPGKYSVNARGAVKLIGTSQRIMRGASLFSASIAVEFRADLVDVLTRVNEHLELEWNPQTFGFVSTESPGVSATQVRQAVHSELLGASSVAMACRQLTENLRISRPIL